MLAAHIRKYPQSDTPLSRKRTYQALTKHVAPVLTAIIILGCASQERLGPAEKTMLSTYPLVTSNAIGSGFLMAVRDRQTRDKFVPVVVTSSHLLKAVEENGIVMPLRVFDASGELFLVLADVGKSQNKSSWYVKHPSLDIAAFELPLSASLSQHALFLLEEGNIETKPTVRAGEEVCIGGYPDGMPTSQALLPVLREGKIASIEQSLLSTRSFLINIDVYPGDSGAPVFRSGLKGRPQIVGMVIELLDAGEQQNLPLAAAVDAQAILETLQLLEAHRR